MSVYGELDPMVEHMTQFAFKGKRKHIAKVNMPNIAYPNQHTVKSAFNLDIESTDKTRSIVNNLGRVLVRKKVLMLGSKDINTINNSDVYEKFKDLYLSE